MRGCIILSLLWLLGSVAACAAGHPAGVDMEAERAALLETDG
jgi:hypothetical protein